MERVNLLTCVYKHSHICYTKHFTTNYRCILLQTIFTNEMQDVYVLSNKDATMHAGYQLWDALMHHCLPRNVVMRCCV